MSFSVRSYRCINQLLRLLTARVPEFEASRETFRKVFLRRQNLVAELQGHRRKAPRRKWVSGKGHLWAADLTLVFVLGFLPVWIFAVVDYHGSRLVTFQPMLWPNASSIATSLEEAFFIHGAPRRLLTDRGAVFRSAAVEDILDHHGVSHTLTLPAHPWTNGRIERLFRTFKEMLRLHFWLIVSHAQLWRICSDFMTFYNRDRPHSSFGGRTPDEVYFGMPKQRRPLGRVSFFEGRLVWYRFG